MAQAKPPASMGARLSTVENRVSVLEVASLASKLHVELIVAHLSGQQGRDVALIRIRKLLGLQA